MSKLVRKFEKEKYDLAKKYIDEKKISKGLRYLTEDILALLNKGLTKKEVLEIINDELKVNINGQSFYTFCNRVLSKLDSRSADDSQSNTNYRLTPKREKNAHSSSVPAKETKPKQKEIKNEVSEVKTDNNNGSSNGNSYQNMLNVAELIKKTRS